MMPVSLAKEPSAAQLRQCRKEWLEKWDKKAASTTWKNFRKSSCGKQWFSEIDERYHSRCAYCDHSPGRTIDHANPQSKTRASLVFAWANWRLACGDCNHLKGAHTGLIDPVKEDPRIFVRFDLTTGEPSISSDINSKQRKKADRTIKILRLKNQTFDDARCRTQASFLSLLADLIEDKPDARRKVADALDATRSNRAIIRDLILEDDDSLNIWRPIVQRAVELFPYLELWALSPLEQPYNG